MSTGQLARPNHHNYPQASPAPSHQELLRRTSSPFNSPEGSNAHSPSSRSKHQPSHSVPSRRNSGSPLSQEIRLYEEKPQESMYTQHANMPPPQPPAQPVHSNSYPQHSYSRAAGHQPYDPPATTANENWQAEMTDQLMAEFGAMTMDKSNGSPEQRQSVTSRATKLMQEMDAQLRQQAEARAGYAASTGGSSTYDGGSKNTSPRQPTNNLGSKSTSPLDYQQQQAPPIDDEDMKFYRRYPSPVLRKVVTSGISTTPPKITVPINGVPSKQSPSRTTPTKTTPDRDRSLPVQEEAEDIQEPSKPDHSPKRDEEEIAIHGDRGLIKDEDDDDETLFDNSVTLPVTPRSRSPRLAEYAAPSPSLIDFTGGAYPLPPNEYYRPAYQYYEPQNLHPISDDGKDVYSYAPRPGAPIPPTTAASSPLPPPKGPIPPLPTSRGQFRPSPAPYPSPFSHVRRANTYAGPTHEPVQHEENNGYYDVNDPNHPYNINAALAMHMRMYAMNNQALHGSSESTASPRATPTFGNGYGPPLLTDRFNFPFDAESMRSSPSHEPISPIRHKARRSQGRGSGLKYLSSGNGYRTPKSHVPPRVDSTQPRETSPENMTATSDGEEPYVELAGPSSALRAITNDDEEDDEWIDEDEDNDEDDLLELELHPSFVANVQKRRRRWDGGWDAVISAVQALDRQTDATIVLMAAPSHSKTLHVVTSRSIRRKTDLLESEDLQSMRTSFQKLARTRRRLSQAAKQKVSLADRLLQSSGGASQGASSDGSSESREGELKRALEGALHSLSALHELYNQREARWTEERQRLSDDRENVEFLINQALGRSLPLGSQLPPNK